MATQGGSGRQQHSLTASGKRDRRRTQPSSDYDANHFVRIRRDHRGATVARYHLLAKQKQFAIRARVALRELVVEHLTAGACLARRFGGVAFFGIRQTQGKIQHRRSGGRPRGGQR